MMDARVRSLPFFWQAMIVGSLAIGAAGFLLSAMMLIATFEVMRRDGAMNERLDTMKDALASQQQTLASYHRAFADQQQVNAQVNQCFQSLNQRIAAMPSSQTSRAPLPYIAGAHAGRPGEVINSPKKK